MAAGSITVAPVRARKAEAARGRARFAVLALTAALFLALSACATVSHATVPSGGALTSLLSPSAMVYASINVTRSATLVSDVLERSGLSKAIPTSIVDKTSHLYAAVTAGANGKPVYSLIAQGDYPAGLIAWRLDWSRRWRRMSRPASWWEDSHTGAQIAVPARSLLMVSNGEVPAMLRRLTTGTGQSLGPQVRTLFSASDLALYFPKPHGGFPILGINPERFPVDSVYLSMRSDGAGAKGYRGYAVFRMNNERDARLFSVVFKLLIAGAAGGGTIGGFPIPLAGATLSVDGATIRMDGISVDEHDLANLLAIIIGPQRARTNP